MSETDEVGRKDPTARLESALERIATAVQARREAGDLPTPVMMEVSARLDGLIKQVRGALQPAVPATGSEG